MSVSNFKLIVLIFIFITLLTSCIGDPFSYKRPQTKKELSESEESKKDQSTTENIKPPPQSYTDEQIILAYYKRDLDDAIAMGSMWYVDPADCDNLQLTALTAYLQDNNTPTKFKYRESIGSAGVSELSLSAYNLFGVLDLQILGHSLPIYTAINSHHNIGPGVSSKFIDLEEEAIIMNNKLYSTQYTYGDLRQYIFPSMFQESGMLYLLETSSSYYNGLASNESLKYKGDVFAKILISDAASNILDRTRDVTRYAKVSEVVFDVTYEQVSLDKALVLSTSNRIIFETTFDDVVNQDRKVRIINLRKFTSRSSNFIFANNDSMNPVQIIENDLVTPADLSLEINGFIMLAGTEGNELGVVINIDLGHRDNNTVKDDLLLTIGAARCPFDSQAGCDQILNYKP